MSTPKTPRKARKPKPKPLDPRAWPKVRPRSPRPPPDAEPLYQRPQRAPHASHGPPEGDRQPPILVTLSGAVVNALLFLIACIIAAMFASCATKFSERVFPLAPVPVLTGSIQSKR